MSTNYTFSIFKFLMLVIIFASCKKDATNPNSNTVSAFPTKWSITNKGTYSNEAESIVLLYDSLKRVSQISDIQTNNSVVEYSDIYSFNYNGTDSFPISYIENVVEAGHVSKISHFIKFDSNHRILKDSSISDSQLFNNISYNYSSNRTVINTRGFNNKMDTIIYSGLDISKHSNYDFSRYDSWDYTYSNNYINQFYKLKALSLISIGNPLLTSYHLPETENHISNMEKSLYSFINYTFDNGVLSKAIQTCSNGDVTTIVVEY